MNRWPAWADVFPNITLLPKIEAKTFIMHVSHAVNAGSFVISPLSMCSDVLHTDPAVSFQSQQVPLPLPHVLSYNMFSAACKPCICFSVYLPHCSSLGMVLCVLMSHCDQHF